MKILLLGANGQLGQAFLCQGGLASRADLIAATRDGQLADGARALIGDLSDPISLSALLNTECPDIIVNAAAYTAVDKAEDDELQATKVNGTALHVIGTYAAARGTLVIHYSTDYVFSGDANKPYICSAEPSPQGAYGRSKLAGEEALRKSGAAHMIFRTAWVYSPVGHNFLRTMLRLGTSHDEVRVVADQHGTPTTTEIIVNGTLAAIDCYLAADSRKTDLVGTYHLTATGETTWHEFADTIFDEAVARKILVKRPKLHAITSSEFPTRARRPAYSVLDTTLFTKTFSHELPHWRDGLKRTMCVYAMRSPC